MRLAYLVNAFPILSETFVREQIFGMMERGHHVEIYALDVGGDTARVVDERIGRWQADARVYHLRAPAGWLARAGGAWRAARGADAACVRGSLDVARFGRDALGLGLLYRSAALARRGRQRYDVIHAQFGPLGHIAVRLRQLGLWEGAIVTSFRGYDATQLLRRRPNRYREVFREGELALPVSGALQRALIAHGADPSRVEVHHSGIDCASFPCRERTRRADEPLRVLSVARLVPKKGIDDAVRAVARLAEDGVDVRYEVIGSGGERPRIEELIDRLALRDRITLLGERSHPEVRARLEDAHVLLAPSVTAKDGDQEGIPNVLKEAMASGMPVVATRHGGIPELVEDGVSGYLVAERDVASLADRLAFLARHPERWGEMGRSGRAKVEAGFDRRRLNEELENLYRLARERHARRGVAASAGAPASATP